MSIAGKMADVNVLDLLRFEAGAFYVMDRGYLDFSRQPEAAPEPVRWSSGARNAR